MPPRKAAATPPPLQQGVFAGWLAAGAPGGGGARRAACASQVNARWGDAACPEARHSAAQSSGVPAAGAPAALSLHMPAVAAKGAASGRGAAGGGGGAARRSWGGGGCSPTATAVQQPKGAYPLPASARGGRGGAHRLRRAAPAPEQTAATITYRMPVAGACAARCAVRRRGVGGRQQPAQVPDRERAATAGGGRG